MIRDFRAIVLGLVLAVVGPARGQEPAVPPACAPFEDTNGPLLVGDPLLDGPRGAAALGWFGAAELDAVAPHVYHRVSGPVVGGSPAPFDVPHAALGWTPSARVELGYRFGQGTGELLTAYRVLSASGTDPFPGLPGGVRSSLNMNVLDLDYASYEDALGPLWAMKWRVGVRLANVYFDSRAAAAPDERATSIFNGAGPMAGLDLRRSIGNNVALFGRVEGSSPIGRVSQNYTGAFVVPDTSAGLLRKTGPVFSLGGQAGLTWCWDEQRSVTAGYLIEQWWGIGFANTTRGDVRFQGAFLRAEWKY
jgi:hypothetical protein